MALAAGSSQGAAGTQQRPPPATTGTLKQGPALGSCGASSSRRHRLPRRRRTRLHHAVCALDAALRGQAVHEARLRARRPHQVLVHLRGGRGGGGWQPAVLLTGLSRGCACALPCSAWLQGPAGQRKQRPGCGCARLEALEALAPVVGLILLAHAGPHVCGAGGRGGGGNAWHGMGMRGCSARGMALLAPPWHGMSAP